MKNSYMNLVLFILDHSGYKMFDILFGEEILTSARNINYPHFGSG